MKIHNDLSEVDHTIFKTLGIDEEQFLSLPEEYQKMFLFYDWQLCNHHNLLDDEMQKKTLFDNNENVNVIKKKILTLFKKK